MRPMFALKGGTMLKSFFITCALVAFSALLAVSVVRNLWPVLALVGFCFLWLLVWGFTSADFTEEDED